MAILTWLRRVFGRGRDGGLALSDLVALLRSEVQAGIDASGRRGAAVESVTLEFPVDTELVYDAKNGTSVDGESVSVELEPGGTDGTIRVCLHPRTERHSSNRNTDSQSGGIGSRIAALDAEAVAALRSAGLGTIEHLAAASEDEIATAADVTTERAAEIVRTAQHLSIGAEHEMAHALATLGITRADLADMTPTDLIETVEGRLSDDGDLSGVSVTLREAAALVSAARERTSS